MSEKESLTRIRIIGGFGGGLGASSGNCDCDACSCLNTQDTTSNVKVADVTAVYKVAKPVVSRT
jgi:hypothetical protein